jgi:hypothetical protein
VLVLDENVRLEQKAILAAWGIRARKIGPDLAAHGVGDADLITLLLTLSKPTFFTHDKDFWTPALLHSSYCLVWLDTEDVDAARYIRRFLRHVDFDTNAKRVGKVVRVHPDSLTFYDSAHGKAKQLGWLRTL